MQNVDFKLTLNKVENNTNPYTNEKNNSEINETYATNNNNNVNNQKQKEAISNKYIFSHFNANLNTNKHINNNFNVIDEIIEEETFSRSSIKVNNADLELIILQSTDTKISDKFKNKNKNNLINQIDKTKEDKKQQLLRNGNNAKSSSNFASQNSKIKTYIKENKQKILVEGPVTNTINTEASLPSNNEVQSTRNFRTIRVSPDTALRNNFTKVEREAVSKGKEICK